MKEADPKLQARLWLTLARSSGLPVDQLTAYQTAVSILNGMFTQAFARIELGEWLYANRFPVRVRPLFVVDCFVESMRLLKLLLLFSDFPAKPTACDLDRLLFVITRCPLYCAPAQDAMDQLLAAADSLLEVMNPSLEDEGGDAGDASSYFSKSQSRGSGSRAGSRTGGSSVRKAASVRSGQLLLRIVYNSCLSNRSAGHRQHQPTAFVRAGARPLCCNSAFIS